MFTSESEHRSRAAMMYSTDARRPEGQQRRADLTGDLKIHSYDTLPEEATLIRREVFMDEQGYKDEFDETDACARHLVAFLGAEPAATCRLFAGERDGELVLGRLAVRKALRGHHLGARIIEAAEADALAEGATSITLHAQADKQGFYERCGYVASGPRDLDEGVPHVWMSKRLSNAHKAGETR